MPGLVPGIRVLNYRSAKEDVDGRVKPGHDGQTRLNPSSGKRIPPNSWPNLICTSNFPCPADLQ